MSTPRRITILGSTGSIGRQALDVVRYYPDRFEVVGLAAHSNDELLASQIEEFRPAEVVVTDAGAAARLRGRGLPCSIGEGDAALSHLAAVPADIVLCAVVGALGLKPVLSALDAGNAIAVANKETFVMAGRLIMERAASRGIPVLPVDSEHNAIFQCLQGHRKEDVRCIHLTASGGPFYGKRREELRAVTPAQATRHPTWNMGAKISVDSATLMNKGLEIVEAMWLFGLAAAQIEVVIHPQSIVHSLVEFTDGHILAHLGVTDMKFPILFALAYPDRVANPMDRLDLTRMRELTFAAPDFSAFPCLSLARQAAAEGGTAPAILNAANEVAVGAFCEGRLPFICISDVVAASLDSIPATQAYDLDSILEADAAARRTARECVAKMGLNCDAL
ncbi:MAG: 1-deoxy-D-xylulose-5-phosphate reductoisomerase [Candidatus Hydrogenedentes bacterium]|nr:1-deoxy-D-xylulose-5-phosphate reductoisomerase [Candidatus Hydrogenedentota bacterium]